MNELGETERLTHNFDAAVEYYDESLRLGKRIGYEEGVAAYTGNVAQLAIDRADWTVAEARAREALALAEKVGRRELVGRNYLRLALSLARLDRYAEGLIPALRALEILSALRLPLAVEAEELLNEYQNVAPERRRGIVGTSAN